ncbi:MAG: universal stress protein [Deltaproteobacteria bacterium]|nr:universal stress protein [Deltaproteobacteria bacterium]
MPALHRILVPVDFSDASSAAVTYAAFLARRFEAGIVLLHVWEPPHLLVPEVVLAPPEGPPQTLAEFATAHADRQMTELVAELGAELRGRVQVMVEVGHPATRIVEVARRASSDLIVMGTHGRHGLSRLLLGSVAQNVVRRAPCPVLTVHGFAQPEEKSS